MNPMDDPQDMLEKDNIIGEATNQTTSSINSSLMEVKQTNVVKFHGKLESIAVDVRDIRKIQAICTSVRENPFPIAEIFLGLASLFAGAFFSALISGVPFELNAMCILFYIIAPVISVGCIVAYCFSRNNERTTAKDLAVRILEYLPEEDNIEDGGQYNEP